MSVRELLARFRADLPAVVRDWTLVALAVGLLAGATGAWSWPDGFWIGVMVLFLGISVAPMVWMSPLIAGMDILLAGAVLKALVLVFSWAILSGVPVLLVIIALSRTVGVQ